MEYILRAEFSDSEIALAFTSEFGYNEGIAGCQIIAISFILVSRVLAYIAYRRQVLKVV
jgi:hypothetical protein